MNADPFRPLPTRADYESDMRHPADAMLEDWHLHEPRHERRAPEGAVVAYVLLGVILPSVLLALFFVARAVL